MKNIKLNLHKIKLWIGFTFLGWFVPENYEYGYCIDRYSVIKKYRDNDGIIHSKIVVFPTTGIEFNE